MRQNDKELLIRDLCARLPYGVIVHLEYDKNTSITREMGIGSLHDIMFDSAEGKPYLRPMSSMTEEERLLFYQNTLQYNEETGYSEYTYKSIDWLNKYHFDYRGLIERDIAIEAPKGMYK